jgi:TRAP transporter TAXI family solute receptor
VVVAARSPIKTVAELRGKRVGIGLPDSGTRENALAVLLAHGLERTDLGTAREQGTDEAVRQLRSGSLDAFFVTIAAPTSELQTLATRGGMRLSRSTTERRNAWSLNGRVSCD